MNKLEKVAIQSLRKTLQRKALHASLRATEANKIQDFTNATHHSGLAVGYFCSIAELDSMLKFLEKE